MYGKWKVSSQYIGDEKIFQVYRLRDISKVDHSGNREYAGEIIYDQDAAYAVAKGLNDGEGIEESIPKKQKPQLREQLGNQGNT
ncbi:hypothetical protein BXY41_106239 [Lacrimispora xylanisolvens]|uniref:Uncharacterized protein n=1 Tax=Lacrimispora xylanisolvens TaxID=384636 RepID=A0A2S6HSR2_9FIRM|nr:hypothetical protein [Hungatella xylanolytica]PPK80649.1 hypothetical protein BXY41_106239 [Hungatella xylanolytica]